MALSANKAREFSPMSYTDTVYAPVNGADTIYQGGAVGLDASGYAIPLTTSAVAFVGFSREEADNSAGADGAIECEILPRGVIHGVTVTGASQALIGDSVYMSDDDTFTMTAGSNIKIGHLQFYDATNGSQVYFIGRYRRSTT